MNKAIFLTLLFLLILPSQFYSIKASSDTGFDIGIHYLYSGKDSIRVDLEKIKSNGFKVIRFPFIWEKIEPYEGVFDFSYYDALLQEALRLELKIIGILGFATTDFLPSWLKDGIDDPSYLDKLARYSRAVLERYAGKVEIWQIENELNHIDAYKWVGWRTGNWSEDQIISVLNLLSKQVRQYTRDKIMINVIVDNPNWLWFLKKVQFIEHDIIGLDYYPNYLDDFKEDAGNPSKGFEIYNYIKEAKKLGKEVIVAETGYSTYNALHSYENQKRFVEEILKGALLAGVKKVVFYHYKDTIKGEHIEENFGLIAYDGSEKPAWKRIKELSQGFKLKIQTFLDGKETNLYVTIENISIETPLEIILPPLNLKINITNNITNENLVIKLENVTINNLGINNPNIIFTLNNDTTIKIFYSKYYQIKVFLKVKDDRLYIPSLKIKLNSSDYEIIDSNLFLKEGKYKVELPNEIIISDRKFKVNNNNFEIFVNLTNREIFIDVIPIYKLNIIVKSWLGLDKQIKIMIKGNTIKSVQSSNYVDELQQETYVIEVSSFYTISEKIELNKDTYLIFYMPEELLLIPPLLFFIIPLYLIVRKNKALDVKKIKVIADIGSSIFFYIILPYYGLILISEILIRKPIIFYSFNDIILFGGLIIAAKALKLNSKTILISEILSTLFNILYVIFIIGRALYSEFGSYYLELFNTSVQVNIAPYLLMIITLIAMKGFLNFSNLYYAKK